MISYNASKTSQVITWISQILGSLIMTQTLYFKFSGAEESVYIFTKIGMEPWGRIGTGITELIASLLLLIPTLVWMGAAVGFGLMAGAIFFHLTILGIEIMGDEGYLFFLALAVFLCCLFILFMRRHQIFFIKKWVD